MKINILTDSTSYLGGENIETYGIDIVSLNISFEDMTLKETEITNKEFYPLMKKKGIPKSSQPSLYELEEAIKKQIAEGGAAVCIFLSSKMSGTYQSALMIKNQILENNPLAKIEVIDSMSNSMQLGFAALSGAKAGLSGLSLEEVKNNILGNIKKSRFLFIPDNLEYLEKGGRIGKAGAILGNLFKIIPILTVENGVTTIYGKVRTKQKAVIEMMNKVLEDMKNFGGLTDIIIHHINAFDEALALSEKLQSLLNISAIPIHDIGPVIGLHVGPGAVGIVYCTKEDLR